MSRKRRPYDPAERTEHTLVAQADGTLGGRLRASSPLLRSAGRWAEQAIPTPEGTVLISSTGDDGAWVTPDGELETWESPAAGAMFDGASVLVDGGRRWVASIGNAARFDHTTDEPAVAGGYTLGADLAGGSARIASDGAGTLMAVASNRQAVSTDGGATWTDLGADDGLVKDGVAGEGGTLVRADDDFLSWTTNLELGASATWTTVAYDGPLAFRDLAVSDV